MSNNPNRYQRKILFVKKEFQARIIAIILLSVFVFSNVSLSLMIIFMTNLFANESINELLASDKFFTMVIPSMLVIEVIGLLIILYLSLFVSHRMAGPIYRLEKCAGQIEAGDLSLDVRIRPYDEFQELATALDKMVKSLRERVSGVRDLFSSLRQSERLVAGHLEKNDIEKARKEFGEMCFLLESVDDLISEFKLENVREKPSAAIVQASEPVSSEPSSSEKAGDA